MRDALFDDLNAPQALAAVFDFVHAANADLDRRGSDRSALDEAASALEFIEATLGIVPPVRLGGATVPVQGVKATPEVGALHVAIVNDETRQETALREFVEEQIRARQAARGRRDFATADAIRAELEAKGIALADSGAGTSWKVREVRERSKRAWDNRLTPSPWPSILRVWRKTAVRRRSSMAEQLICNQQVASSTLAVGSVASMFCARWRRAWVGYPSGQREQTVNLPA